MENRSDTGLWLFLQ